jgi:hypothetical protein
LPELRAGNRSALSMGNTFAQLGAVPGGWPEELMAQGGVQIRYVQRPASGEQPAPAAVTAGLAEADGKTAPVAVAAASTAAAGAEGSGSTRQGELSPPGPSTAAAAAVIVAASPASAPAAATDSVSRMDTARAMQIADAQVTELLSASASGS